MRDRCARTTLGLAAALVALAMRGRLLRTLVPILVVAAAITTACGGKSSNTGGTANPANRPTTDARLQIVQPTANQVTGPELTVELKLIGARVVPATTTKGVRPDQGHIHLSLDGQLVSMTFGLSQDLHKIKPGPHSIQAEFVASDHSPFENRVIAAVLFTVRA